MGRQSLGNSPIVTWPIDGSDIASPPTNLINANAFQFVFSRTENFGKKIGDTPVTAEFQERIAQNAGQITGFHAQVETPGSAASVTVDLKVNGATVLSAVITLTNATAAHTQQDATVSLPTFVKGDRISISLTVTTSTGMAGVTATVNAVENGQPI